MRSYYKTENLILLLLFACGILLRFYDFWTWSFTNDELSALGRLRFDNLSSLFNEGIRVDGHPALVQLFLYIWTSIVGVSEFWVRLPFVLAGILSLFYFNKFSKLLLTKNAAFVALSIYSCSYPLVLYSQLARPYAIGLLFVMGFAYYWIKLIKFEANNTNYFGFISFGFLGIITHYFASFSIAILIITGVFMVNKSQLKKYLLSILAISILFLPHFPITLSQLSIGGLSWIPLPKYGFIFKFIQYAFNDSLWFIGTSVIIPVIALFSKRFQVPLKNIALLFLFFMIPYWVAFYYSLYFLPVLQYSVLIFSLPFLILLLSAFITDYIKPKVVYLLCILILITGSYSLIVSNQFYEKKPFANFKKVAKDINSYCLKYGKENMLVFTNGNEPNYLAHYLNKYDSPVKPDINHFKSIQNTLDAIHMMDTTKKEYALLAFANGPIPSTVHEFSKQKFPLIVEHNRYFNSETIVYKRSKRNRKILYQSKAENFEQNKKWEVTIDLLDHNKFHTEPNAFFVPDSVEYALTFREILQHVIQGKNRYITISALFKSAAPSNGHIVTTISYHGEQLAWQSINLRDFWKSNQWTKVIDVIELKEEFPLEAEISIYFWNREFEEISIDDFKITNFADSDYNYYDF